MPIKLNQCNLLLTAPDGKSLAMTQTRFFASLLDFSQVLPNCDVIVHIGTTGLAWQIQQV